MKLTQTMYAVKDPQTGQYLSGGSPYDKWVEPQDERGRLRLGLFATKNTAGAAKNKRARNAHYYESRGMDGWTRMYGTAAQAEGAIVVALEVTTEVVEKS